MERYFPNSDGIGSQQAGRGAEAQHHQSARDDGKKPFLEFQKGHDMDFVATQEATASCWSGSKAR